MQPSDPNPLALDLRDGLPDALRTLIKEYPRDLWESHSNFDGLVRFWLERHQMFRKLLVLMQQDIESLLDNNMDPAQFMQRLARLGNLFVGELHTHHNIEDHHYFPVLQKHDLSIAHGFDLLESDHHLIEERLNDFTLSARTLMNPEKLADKNETGLFHDGLKKMDDLLNRHLIDEEELVVPTLLKYGMSM